MNLIFITIDNLKTVGAFATLPVIVLYLLELRKHKLLNKQLAQDTTLKLYKYLEEQNVKLIDNGIKSEKLIEHLYKKLEEGEEERKQFIAEMRGMKDEIKQLRIRVQLFEKKLLP